MGTSPAALAAALENRRPFQQYLGAPLDPERLTAMSQSRLPVISQALMCSRSAIEQLSKEQPDDEEVFHVDMDDPLRFFRADVVEATFDETAPPPTIGMREESEDEEDLNEQFVWLQPEATHGSGPSAAAPAPPSSSRFGSDVVAAADAVAGGAEVAADVAMPPSPITPPSARWFPFGASYCDEILFNQNMSYEEVIAQLRHMREGHYRHHSLPLPPPVPTTAMTPAPVVIPTPPPPQHSVDEGLAQLTAAALMFNTMD